eukprot:3851757-Karenia_brevis.AAC.1
MAARMAWLPIGFHRKALMLQAGVVAKAMHACAANAIPRRLLNKLRTAAVQAVWNDKRRFRCREIVLTLFVEGHRTDPWQYLWYTSLRQLRKILDKHRDLHPLFE